MLFWPLNKSLKIFDPPTQLLATRRFRDMAERAQFQNTFHIIDRRNDLNRNVSCRRIVFQPVEHGVSVNARQRQIESDGIRTILAGRNDRFLTVLLDDAFEAQFMCRIKQRPRKGAVVLDDDPVIGAPPEGVGPRLLLPEELEPELDDEP